MGAYDRIFSIAVIVAVIMLGLSTFLGLYIPTVSASVDSNGDLVLDRESKNFEMSLVKNGQLYFVQDDQYMNLGPVRFSITPQQVDNDSFAMVIGERVGDETFKSYNYGTLDEGYTFDEAKSLTFQLYSENKEINPNDFYFEVDSITPADQIEQLTTMVEQGSGDVVEMEVGRVTISGYYGNKPIADAGFRDVVFGMFSFNIPLVPGLINTLVSSIMLFCLSFVVFAIALKLAPMLG